MGLDPAPPQPDFSPPLAPIAVPPPLAYATPVQFDASMWRDARILVSEINAGFPPRCVKCNAPAVWRLNKKVYWISTWYLLTIFLSVPVFLIIYFLVRKSTYCDAGLCDEHLRRRKNRIRATWLIALTSVAGFVSGAVLIDQPAWRNSALPALLMAGGAAAFVVAVLVAAFATRVVMPMRITDKWVRFKGASDAFLDSLPVAQSR